MREWEIGWKLCILFEWGKGYATEAAKGMLKYTFNDLQAHRVVAFCNTLNGASIRVMEKIGMRREGLLEKTRWWNNGWANEYIYAILERDWK